MKKITAFFILVLLFCFVSCDTTTHYINRVSVDRNPTLSIVNQTGYPVVVTAPVPSNINNGASIQFQPTETNRSIAVTYRIDRSEFTEQVTMNNTDATVTLTKRPPTITVVNQTGYLVSITVPVTRNIDAGGRTNFLSPVSDQNINIAYTIGRMRFTERVSMSNQDITVTLTRYPPTLTIVNNVGATINTLWIRTPGAPIWIGGNIVNRGGGVDIAGADTGGAQIGDISGSIVNGDRMQIWMGQLPISGDGDNRFDIRTDDVQGNSYVRSNVQILNDTSLTFTARDRP